MLIEEFIRYKQLFWALLYYKKSAVNLSSRPYSQEELLRILVGSMTS